MSLSVTKWPEAIPLEKDRVAAAWSNEGFDCHLWVDVPGKSWLDYTHAVDEKIVVQQGRIEFEVEGEHTILGPRDEILIPAGRVHSVWNRGRTTAYWFYGYRRLEGSGS